MVKYGKWLLENALRCGKMREVAGRCGKMRVVGGFAGVCGKFRGVAGRLRGVCSIKVSKGTGGLFEAKRYLGPVPKTNSNKGISQVIAAFYPFTNHNPGGGANDRGKFHKTQVRAILALFSFI
eukprot:sb/3475864/